MPLRGQAPVTPNSLILHSLAISTHYKLEKVCSVTPEIAVELPKCQLFKALSTGPDRHSRPLRVQAGIFPPGTLPSEGVPTPTPLPFSAEYKPFTVFSPSIKTAEICRYNSQFQFSNGKLFHLRQRNTHRQRQTGSKDAIPTRKGRKASGKRDSESSRRR